MRTLLSVMMCVLGVLFFASGIANAGTYPIATEKLEPYFETKAEEGLDSDALKPVMTSILHGIQLSLERYAVDNNGVYPESIDELVINGYISAGLYPNPVTAEDAKSNTALDVPFGWSDMAPGNFTYLKHYNDFKVSDYVLVGYGFHQEGTIDLNADGVDDGVILLLYNKHHDAETDQWEDWLVGVQQMNSHGEVVEIKLP